MADKSAEKERLFNEWFTKSYDRLRGTLRRYGMLDEDNFHDTYLFVRRQVLVPGKDITDYDAYFIGCYKKAALIKIKRENRYAHPEDDFFLRCGEEAKFLSEDDLNGCERLVRDILRFVRQKFSYEEYRMFMLRFYEAQFSFKGLVADLRLYLFLLVQPLRLCGYKGLSMQYHFDPIRLLVFRHLLQIRKKIK